MKLIWLNVEIIRYNFYWINFNGSIISTIILDYNLWATINQIKVIFTSDKWLQCNNWINKYIY